MSTPTDPSLPYRNRLEAGEVLAHSLEEAGAAPAEPAGTARRPIVLALPRGGVPVAHTVAQALNADLDLILVRKLGLPGQEEFAMGAIASGGVKVLNKDVLAMHQVTEEAIEQVATREGQELKRREQAYRGERPYPDLRGRRVFLVDDGLATGATMRAAVRVVRKQHPGQLVIAVPVAPSATLADLRSQADQIICPATPEPFLAIGRWYRDFGQTTDDEVRRLLADAWRISS